MSEMEERAFMQWWLEQRTLAAAPEVDIARAAFEAGIAYADAHP
jgi:hypothetical protein